LENPALYRVLFLVGRALAGFRNPALGSAEDSSVAAGTKHGISLTGDVFLPSQSPPAGAATATEANRACGQRVELSGTLFINSNDTNSITLNFHQAGQMVRILYLTGIHGDHKSGSQMKYLYPPPHDDDMAEASG